MHITFSHKQNIKAIFFNSCTHKTFIFWCFFRPRGLSGEASCIPQEQQAASKVDPQHPPTSAESGSRPLTASPASNNGSPGGRQFGGVAHVAPCTVVPTPLCRPSAAATAGHFCQGKAPNAGRSGGRPPPRLQEAQQGQQLEMHSLKQVQTNYWSMGPRENISLIVIWSPQSVESNFNSFLKMEIIFEGFK